MKKLTPAWQTHTLLLLALLLSIPAFYLILAGMVPLYRNAGRGLYVVVALLLGGDLLRSAKSRRRHDGMLALDWLILFGAVCSVWPSNLPWSMLEWGLRMGYCGIVFLRLLTFFGKRIVSSHLLHVVVFALVVLAVAGAGFMWLEPRVHSYADGVWLAFITGATVGYGDLVPSTPASRIFAAFIVLLGYALFSVVTASISAVLVGEDEKRLERELHADMRLLRQEISLLHKELHTALAASSGKGHTDQEAVG